MQARTRGYVVGADKVKGITVWKVRVKDETSEHNGKKFAVASTHGKIYLAEGLEVSFLLGQFQEAGQAVLKAIDVEIFSETQAAKRAPLEKISATQEYDTLNILITECHGELNVYFTGYETEKAAAAFYVKETGIDEEYSERVIGFIPFSIYDWMEEDADPDIVNAFMAIRSLIVAFDPIQDALAKMMTATIRSFAKGKED